MGAFEFVALDKSGKESKGLVEGDTAKHVRQILRERSLLDFDDLILRTVHLLEQAPAVREKYARRFRHARLARVGSGNAPVVS